MDKLRTIRLYGKLGAKFGRVHKLYVSSSGEAIRALSVQKPGFLEELRDSDKNGVAYTVFYGNTNLGKEELLNPVGDGDIRIAPVIQGNKRAGLFQVLVGVVLIAASWYMGGAAGWAYLGAQGYGMATAAFMLGASSILGGVAQMLSPQAKVEMDMADGKSNTAFSGPVNNVVAGVPVPIAIGRVIIGSSVISASIVSEDAVA